MRESEEPHDLPGGVPIHLPRIVTPHGGGYLQVAYSAAIAAWA
jgi:hypothetical protein